MWQQVDVAAIQLCLTSIRSTVSDKRRVFRMTSDLPLGITHWQDFR